MNWWLSEQVGRMAERRERTAMAYTKELQDWVARQEHAEDADNWAMVHALSVAAAHKHLSAFAKLVEKEAMREPSIWSFKDHRSRVGAAFNAICERFGLEVSNGV